MVYFVVETVGNRRSSRCVICLCRETKERMLPLMGTLLKDPVALVLLSVLLLFLLFVGILSLVRFRRDLQGRSHGDIPRPYAG